jgi:branched-chain amino acid transport system permease protein
MLDARASNLRVRLFGAACLIAAVALPFVASTYYTQFFAKVLIMGMLAISLNLVVGHGGLVSICHAAFLASQAMSLRCCRRVTMPRRCS